MASKSQNDVINAIKELQLSALSDMKVAASLLGKEVDRVQKKIDSVGTNGYYSINSDVMTYSTKLWKSSLRLGELKRYEEEMKSQIKKARKLRLSKADKTCS